MDKGKEVKNGVLSVPQFGGWENKAVGATDYSMVFSRARANKKQHKASYGHRSFGNEQELNPVVPAAKEDDTSMKKKKFRAYFSCFRP